MSFSFRFHNKVLKHSNSFRTVKLLSGLLSWPLPGNVPHQIFMDGKNKRSEKQWDRLLEKMQKSDNKLYKLWWRLHPEEIYWMGSNYWCKKK